jgi:RNA polymerase sigma-70 factor (ECF subfamily)
MRMNLASTTQTRTALGRNPRHGKLPDALDEARAMSEDLLLAIAQHRDRDAFARLFTWFAPRVKGQLMAAGMDSASAEELAQEVMLNVWRKASLFDPRRGAASTWIFAMTRNRFLNTVRRRAAPEPELVDTLDDSPHAESTLIMMERNRMLDSALAELPDEQRSALRGAYFSGRSLREVAEAQDVPLGTIKTRLRLALERLRKVITPTGGGQP